MSAETLPPQFKLYSGTLSYQPDPGLKPTHFDDCFEAKDRHTQECNDLPADAPTQMQVFSYTGKLPIPRRHLPGHSGMLKSDAAKLASTPCLSIGYCFSPDWSSPSKSCYVEWEKCDDSKPEQVWEFLRVPYFKDTGRGKLDTFQIRNRKFNVCLTNENYKSHHAYPICLTEFVTTCLKVGSNPQVKNYQEGTQTWQVLPV